MTEAERSRELMERAAEIARAALDKGADKGDVVDPDVRRAVEAGDLSLKRQVRNEVEGVEIYAAGVAVAWASRLDFPPSAWTDGAG